MPDCNHTVTHTDRTGRVLSWEVPESDCPHCLQADVERLQARNTELADALSFMTAALDPAQSDETADWEITDVRWRLRIDEMQAIVAERPTTADDARVEFGDIIWMSTRRGPKRRRVCVLLDDKITNEPIEFDDCYSTRESAQAARAKEKR